MRAGVLFSGGKDSTFTAFYASSMGFNVILISILPNEYSLMFHHPNIMYTPLQAKAMGFKHILLKNEDLNYITEEIKKLNLDAIFAGGISSNFQRSKLEAIGEEIDVPTYFPLWKKEKELLDEILNYFEVYVTAVSAYGLEKEFLAKPFNYLLENKPNFVDPFLEGGEGETFVTFAPFFKYKIVVKEWEIKWDKVRGVAIIKKAVLQ